MRTIFIILGILFITNTAYAGRVCFEKTTGKLIEYQSGDSKLGTLTKNAINSGYTKNNVEEKYVTDTEWENIREKHIAKPEKEKAKLKENKRKSAKKKLESILTKDEIKALFD